METLVRDLESLGKAVDATNRQEIFGRAVKTIADFLVQRFGVSDAEIALLLMRPSQKVLRFAYPLEHSKERTNLVPLNSPGVATTVVRSGRGIIHNDMSRVTRLDIFELIPTGRGKAVEIQKMVAAPLALSGGEVVGVVEVSRKGKDLQEAGRDFTPAELTDLTQIGAAVAPWLRQLTPFDF
jgi:hypothetical protein